MGKSITEFSSVTRVGLDLAKHVFQVHGVDVAGRVVFNKSVKRDKLLAFFSGLPKCLVGLEACGSAHHWARELIKLAVTVTVHILTLQFDRVCSAHRRCRAARLVNCTVTVTIYEP